MPKLAGLRDFEEAYLVEKCQDDLLFSLRMRFVEISNQEEKEGKEKKE